jgi:hypothetical protein
LLAPTIHRKSVKGFRGGRLQGREFRRTLLAAPSVEAAARALPRHRTVSDVEAAYRAIPHRRTVFDVEAAKMSLEERAYLHQPFDLVDLGIVERVETLTWLRSHS